MANNNSSSRARRNSGGYRTQQKKGNYVDFLMISTVFLLVVFGLLMIYSTTAYKSGNSDFLAQLKAVILGVIIMIVLSLFDIKRIKGLQGYAIITSLAVTFILLTPMKITLNNATRWFKLLGMSVQSAEIVKICMIILMAYILSGKENVFADIKSIIMVLLIPAFFTILLGVISSNLSSALIILLICYSMVFIASPHKLIYLVGGLGGFSLVFGFIKLVDMNVIKFGFRGDRIKMWLHPEDTNLIASLDSDNFQTIQSLYAIGSGGIGGKGIGEGIQKINKIPEAQNDMIFSIVCEELGVIGAGILMMLFFVLIYRLIVLAINASCKFDALLISGVMSQIAIQSILNMAVVTNLIPNTGVSLPFISSGGTSVLCLLAEIGMVIGVSRHNKLAN